MTLLDDFIAAGCRALPNEIAGGLIYAAKTAILRLEIHAPLDSASDRIDYRMPALAPDEVVCVDLHTHGRDRAFFSVADDEDDRSVKVAGVFGHLDREQPSAAFRLVLNGWYKPLPHPWAARLDRVEDAADWPILDAMGCTARKAWNM